MKHPYAETLRAIADDRPIQGRWKNNPWVHSSGFDHDMFLRLILGDDRDYEFEPVPAVTWVNGFKVPAPHSKPLDHGDAYYVADATKDKWNFLTTWAHDFADERWLKRGLIHLSADAAAAHAKALIGLDPNT